MYRIKVPYEYPEDPDRYLEFKIAEENLVAVAQPREVPSITDIKGATLQAVENPVGGPKLTSALSPGKKLAIVVENQFRPSPTDVIVPAIVELAEKAGASSSIVFACGCVPPLNEEERRRKLGDAIINKGIPVYNNETSPGLFGSTMPENYVFKGHTSHGTPVWLHKVVVEADIVVVVGTIQANLWGYGGGAKLLLPGIASYETIEWNHLMAVAPDVRPGNYDNAMRGDINEAGRMLGTVLAVNVTLDPKGNVISLTAGDVLESHRAATSAYDSVYAFDMYPFAKQKADIVVTGTNAPTDHLFFHTGWAVVNCEPIVKPGGTIIQASPCPGYGSWPGFALMNLMKDYLPATKENYEKLLRDIFNRKVEMWAGCIWCKIYQTMLTRDVVIVTDQVNMDFAREVGLNVSTSLQEAYDRALEKHGPAARVAYVPYGKNSVLLTEVESGRRVLRAQDPREAGPNVLPGLSRE